MLLLRLFLRGLIVQLGLGCCFARQAHLRQVHVVSVGEGNVDVDCDDAHGSGCGGALHPENGVLLLPAGKSRWQAFNVHTLMLPQHGASVEEHASQSTLGRFLQHVTRKSATSTLLLLMVVGCLAFLFVNMFNSTNDQPEQNDSENSDVVVGSWVQAYRDARGSRRVALDLLFKTGIIPNQDMCRRDVNPTFIDECIQIAEQMLTERSEKDWVDSWQQAQRSFEERRSAYYKKDVHDMMTVYQNSDGSWATAYRLSNGQPERQEAFELLLRLGITSSDEFANSLVPPKLIEERLAVAMDLLKQKSLKEWVDLCETAHGHKFKESVMACFALQPGVSPRDAGQWSNNPAPSQATTHHRDVYSEQPNIPPIPISTHIQAVPTSGRLQRGTTQEMSESAEGLAAPGESVFTSSARPGEKVTVHHTAPDIGHYSGEPSSALSLSGRSGAHTPTGSINLGSKGKPVFVLPVSPRTGTEPSLSNDVSRSLQSRNPRLAAAERPRTVPSWSMGGSSMPPTSRAPPDASNGTPVQIMFSNNAISGSSWEASVTPPRTPPRTPTMTEKEL